MSASEELIRRIGAIRVSAEIDQPETAAAAREQVNEVDGAIRVAAAVAGTQGAERRDALKTVVPGASIEIRDGKVTSGPKKRSTREETIGRLQVWIASLSPEQRAATIDSDEWLAKQSENVRDAVMEASYDFSPEEETDLTTYDFQGNSPDVDDLNLGDDDDDENVYYRAEPMPWEHLNNEEEE